MMEAEIEAIRRTIESCRLSLGSEKAAQADLERAFLAEGRTFTREHRLSAKDIPDFLVDGIVVEMKTKGSAKDIFRQVERYAAHETVRGIVLATSRAMTLPREILGKPARVVSLGRGWL